MLLENIQVVVICVNYSDFLRITYQQNIRFFNRNNYYIITSKDDQETVDLCIELNIRYETYDDFYINSSKLNKSGAINKIQKRLHNDFPNDWILLLDADIILPNNFVLIDDDSYVVHLGKKDINNRGRITEYWL